MAILWGEWRGAGGGAPASISLAALGALWLSSWVMSGETHQETLMSRGVKKRSQV